MTQNFNDNIMNEALTYITICLLHSFLNLFKKTISAQYTNYYLHILQNGCATFSKCYETNNSRELTLFPVLYLMNLISLHEKPDFPNCQQTSLFSSVPEIAGNQLLTEGLLLVYTCSPTQCLGKQYFVV